jgi:hypothetical protein
VGFFILFLQKNFNKVLLKSKFINFFKLVFPSNLVELGIFLFFIVCYGILGSYIAINYTIIFDDRIPWDAYFSFDNKAIVTTGGGFERHPLSYYFFNWVRELAFMISNNKTDTTFRLALAWFSNIVISLNIIQVFKYLKNIIKLPLIISLLIISFFGCFSTNIILSFTPENFTYSLFLLTLYNHYSAIKLKKEEKTPVLVLTLAAISIGGITITNIVKVFIPIIFEKKLFKSWKKFGNAAFRIAFSCLCFILLYLNRIDFKYNRILDKTGEQYEKFSHAKTIPTWDMILSFFFGGNILLPDFVIQDRHSATGFHYNALLLDVYSSWSSYLFVFILLAMILCGYFRNFKNKLAQVLMISFLIDIIIHCILRFGLHTSFIYGGHFVFIYPLLLGWLFYSYRSFPKVLSFLTLTLTILLVYLSINNYIRLTEFIWFLNQYYQ